MDSHTGQRFKPIDPPNPDLIRLLSTKELLNEIKRRSIGCMLVALVNDDGGFINAVVESKGTGEVFKDVLMAVELERIQRERTL